MLADERFEQSRFGVHVAVGFGAERVSYTLRDMSGERSFNVPYEAVAMLNRGTVTSNNRAFTWRLRLIPAAAIILGLALSGYYPDTGGCIMAVATLAFIALVICGYTRMFAVRFILVPFAQPVPEAQGHPIRIIDDATGASILGQLDLRWKARLKLLHGTADPANDPKRELARLTWLKQNAILSEEEFERETLRLDRGADAEPGPPARPLLN